MRLTITSNLTKSRDENIVKGNEIVIKFTSTKKLFVQQRATLQLAE